MFNKTLVIGTLMVILIGPPAIAEGLCELSSLGPISVDIFNPSLDDGWLAVEVNYSFISLGNGTEGQIVTPPFTSGYHPSVDDRSVAYDSPSDVTGENPDHSLEILLFNGTDVVQITDSASGDSSHPSLSGKYIAFQSTADLTGGNPDGNSEIFQFDGSQIRQITRSENGHSNSASAEKDSIAFVSTADLTGDNPDGNSEIFFFDGSAIRQITDTAGNVGSARPSLHHGAIAFDSTADLAGENADHNRQIFFFEGEHISQITHSQTEISQSPSLDGRSIAFQSSADLTGENPDRSSEIFLYRDGAFTQVTHSTDGSASQPSLDTGTIAFTYRGAPLIEGEPPNPYSQVYLASCACATNETTMCLGSGRGFRATADWTDFDGDSGVAKVRDIGLKSAGLFWFFGESNPEVLVKVINGCSVNGHYWVFAAGTTNVEYSLWVEELESGQSRHYHNPLGKASEAVTDTTAFPCP